MFQLFVNNNTGGANPKWQEVTGSQEDPLRNLLALLDAMTHPGYHHPGDTGSVGTLLGNRDTLVRDPNTGDLLLWRGSIVIIVHNEGSVKKPIYGTKNTTFERELYESGINSTTLVQRHTEARMSPVTLQLNVCGRRRRLNHTMWPGARRGVLAVL